MLTNEIILTNNGRDTLRPLASRLGHLQIVYMSLNTLNDVVQQWFEPINQKFG